MLSGYPPFHHMDLELIETIKRGERPDMPQDNDSRIRGLTTEWWKLITDCWANNPGDRPDACDVFKRLHSLPERKSDERDPNDVEGFARAKREFRRKESNPFAPLFPNEEDHDSEGLFELKNALIFQTGLTFVTGT